MLDIIIQRVHFGLDGEFGIFRREKCGFAKAGVIAGDGIITIAGDRIVIVRTQELLGSHVPIGDEAIVPPGWVAMLRARKKSRAFLEQRLDRFGAEEFEKGLATLSVTNG